MLAEAIQTTMRRYGLEQPYEQLKALTRGKSQSSHTTAIVDSLDLPENVKQALRQLTPSGTLVMQANNKLLLNETVDYAMFTTTLSR